MPALSRRDFLKLTCAVVLAATAVGARAVEDLTLRQVALVRMHDQYVLLGGYTVTLGSKLEEALRKGIPLTFVQMFEATRPRDFWFAEDVAVRKRVVRLTYNALLRHYQLERENVQTAYESLPEALEALGDFADWPVLQSAQLDKRRQYSARARMLLDTSRLAKPLQMNAFASGRWDMDSGWREWLFKP